MRSVRKKWPEALPERQAPGAAVSITGIAGPDGGTKEKPVGLVYIGCCIDGRTWVKCYHMNGDRQKIREVTVKRALDMLRRCISHPEAE